MRGYSLADFILGNKRFYSLEHLGLHTFQQGSDSQSYLLAEKVRLNQQFQDFP